MPKVRTGHVCQWSFFFPWQCKRNWRRINHVLFRMIQHRKGVDLMAEQGFSTRAIHGAHFHSGQASDPIVFPIFQTASFNFENNDIMEDVNAHRTPGFGYSRGGNPTVDAFERTLALLEGAESRSEER